MKFLTALIFSTFATLALACPDLSGEYQCYDEDYGYYTSTVSQTGSGANTTYTMKDYDSNDVITANNKWIHVVQDGNKLKVKASCSGETLTINLEFSDPNAGLIRANVNMSINANNDLASSATVSVSGNNFPAQVSSCTRL